MFNKMKIRFAVWLLGPDAIYIGRSIKIEGLNVTRAANGAVTVHNYGAVEAPAEGA